MTRRRADPAPILGLVVLFAFAGSSAHAQETARVALTTQPAHESTAEQFLETYDAALTRKLEREAIAILEPDPAVPGLVSGLVIFQQPRERAYRLLSQSERQIEYQGDVSAIETVERMPSGSIVEQRLKIMFVKIVYRLEYLLEPRHRIRWQLDPRFENSLEYVSGAWELYPFENGRTLGTFGTTVRVGAALPGWLQDRVTRRKVPDTLEAARKWVDSGGRWRR